jgi:hypothetical protein
VKFLIDNALPPRLADLLVAAGYDAVHVRNYAMHAAADKEIQERALTEDRIIVSADSDFSTLLAQQEADRAVVCPVPGNEPAGRTGLHEHAHSSLAGTGTRTDKWLRRRFSQESAASPQATLLKHRR